MKMTVKISQQEKEELLKLYNQYLDGVLSTDSLNRFWELLYNFSFLFLYHLKANIEIKEDCWQDFIYALWQMTMPFNHCQKFSELDSLFESRLKSIYRKYTRDKDLK